MEACKDCGLEVGAKCICPAVDKFFDENRELMTGMSKWDNKEFQDRFAAATPVERDVMAKDAGIKRCITCFFFDCRCGKPRRK